MVEKKSRIIYLLKMLMEFTDEEHPLTTSEIIDKLLEQDIPAHRITVTQDIALLKEAGFDIIRNKSTQNKYFIGTRKFDTAEIRLLADAAQSARFITTTQSQTLLQKLSSLVSIHQADFVKSNLYATKQLKSTNKSVIYAIDTINQAINQNKQLSFKYYEYTPEKKKVFKHNGEIYKLSPYALYWNDDRYYAIGFSEKHDNTIKFRVDRMAKVEFIDENRKPCPKGFDINKYAIKVFKMFDGEELTVGLKCANEMMKIIIDYFGEEVQIDKLDDNSFKATVSVCVSPVFYGWVFQFGGLIKIISPESVKGIFNNMAENMIG